MSYPSVINVGGELYARSVGYVWDPSTLDYVVAQQAGGSGGAGDASAANQTTEIARLTSIEGKLPALMSAAPGSDTGQSAVPVRVVSQLGAGSGGGGAVTLADGANVTQGAKADVAWDGAAASPTSHAVFKYIAAKIDAVRVLLAGTLVVTGNVGNPGPPLGDVADEDTRLLGRVKNMDSAGTVTDLALKSQLPTALAAGGGVKVEGVAGGVPQPVSGPLTDAQLRASAVPVSMATNTPDVTDRAGRLLGIIASIAAAVDISDRVGRLLGVVTIANLDVALSTRLKPADSLAAVTSITNPVTVTQATLTKGTQGTTGVTTQDLKDAGRTRWSASTVIAGVAGVAAEALLSMVVQRNSAPGGAATTQAVTAAKRLRLTSLTVGIVSTAAAVVSVRAVLRVNPAGALAVTSPIELVVAIPSGAALAQAGGFITIPLPDGLEYAGAEQIGLTHVGSVATYTLWATLNGFEY